MGIRLWIIVNILWWKANTGHCSFPSSLLIGSGTPIRFFLHDDAVILYYEYFFYKLFLLYTFIMLDFCYVNACALSFWKGGMDWMNGFYYEENLMLNTVCRSVGHTNLTHTRIASSATLSIYSYRNEAPISLLYNIIHSWTWRCGWMVTLRWR